MADMASVNYERWSRACIDVGVGPDERDYRRLRRAWRGMGRHYHTLEHLDGCLREHPHRAVTEVDSVSVLDDLDQLVDVAEVARLRLQPGCPHAAP